MSDSELIETSQALAEKLAEILSKGPLYRTYAYSGRNCHFSNISPYGGTTRYGLLPKQLRLYCDDQRCGHETLWEVKDNETDVYFGRSFIYQRAYTCKNCDEKIIHYCFIWQEQEKLNIFIKIG